MTHSIVRRLLLVVLTASLAVGVAGCGDKMSGKYVAAGGVLTIEFKSGQATITDVMGNTEDSDYTVTDNSVTIKSKVRGDVVFTIGQDGSLTGQGVTLKKTAS